MAAAPLVAYLRASKDVKTATGCYSLDCGDVNLYATATHASLHNGAVTANSFSLGLHKPHSFSLQYVHPNPDVHFKFENSFKLSDKALNLSYSHKVRENLRALHGNIELNSANKLSATYDSHSGDAELKYSYVHKQSTEIEPSYNFTTNSFNFSVSRWFHDACLKASYKSSTKVLGMDLSKYSGPSGDFKVSVSVNLGEELRFPKITAEKTWNIGMPSTDDNDGNIELSD